MVRMTSGSTWSLAMSPGELCASNSRALQLLFNVEAPVIEPPAKAKTQAQAPDACYIVPSVAELIRDAIAQARSRGVTTIALDVAALDLLLG